MIYLVGRLGYLVSWIILVIGKLAVTGGVLSMNITRGSKNNISYKKAG